MKKQVRLTLAEIPSVYLTRDCDACIEIDLQGRLKLLLAMYEVERKGIYGNVEAQAHGLQFPTYRRKFRELIKVTNWSYKTLILEISCRKGLKVEVSYKTSIN